MAQMKAQGSLTIIDTNDIESITVEYARNQSTSSPPTSGWSTTRPTWEQGYYIWQRTRIHKTGTSDSEDTFGTAVCITGSTGQTGASLTVSSIRYAISTTESQPADSSFTYTTVPTVAEGSWLWTKTEYSDGSKIYTKSKQGKSGNSVTVTKVEYQSGTSPTTAPTDSWSTSIPAVAEGNYLWTKTTYSDGNYSYTVAKQGQSGTSISITSTSVKYQVGTSATTAPTGTWLDNPQATTTGQYLWTRTIVTYSDSSSTTSYSVAAHGSTGTSVSVSSIKYAVTTTESQPGDSSFSTTFPSTVAEGSWLWTLTTYSNGSKMYTKSKQGKSGNDGRGLTATETKYTNVASGTTQTQVEALVESAWATNVPSYDASKPDYWIRVKNTYDKAPTTVYIYYKDNATGESLYNAAMANSIAQSANENANGAMSQAAANIQTITRIWYAKANSTAPAAPTAHITTSSATTYNAWNIKRPNTNDSYPYYFYCDETCTGGGVYSWSEVTLDTSNLSQYQIGALTAQVKNFWWDSSGAHVASGKNGNEVTKETISTYGYHGLMGLTGISFNYDSAKVVDLNSTTPSLDFYQPPTISGSTVTQGKKTMMLSSNALTFYNPSNGTTAYATLNSNGLKLAKGGIQAGSANQSGFVYLSTDNYGSYSINGSSGISDWKEIIGTKFGVRADGTLYANNAVISGTITVGSGSDLSAGLSDYSTTSQMNSAIGTATNDMATKTYVGNQGYQNANQVNTIIEGKGYALNSDLTTEINQRKAQYGTSSTTASTRIKVVTCADFELIAGNEITVKFSTANTQYSSSVQLNVNSKGAKDVWVANAVTSDTNQLLWGKNAYITFRYDGTQFIVIGEPRTWYGASTTAAGTAAKTDTTAVTGCVICKGAKIELAMSENNTNTSATLNIQSTGAKNIYYGNTTTRPTVDNGHSWLGASTATFTFDGQYYRMAGQTVISGDSITTGTISANRLNISDIISNGNIVVSNQISNFVTQDDIDDTISATSVSNLSDGSDYTKTANLGNTTAVQNAAKTASNYLGDTDSNAGVTLKAQNGTTTANTNTSNYIKINTSGLEVFKGGVSIAQYGDTARIGKTNSSRFLMNASSLQAYNSSNVKYFEVSASGITYGTNTVASTSYADGKASAAQTAAETTAQGYANTAEANASYSVEIQVTSIDYVNNSATLVAIPYYQGSTTMPTGVTLSYRWYKNGTALANTSTTPTISGATTNTLQLGEGTDFGSNTTNAIYTCVIS